MVQESACWILQRTSEYFLVEGAMPGMKEEEPMQVVNVAVLVTNPYSNEKVICVINQCLLITDGSHREGLLQPHQARSFGTAIDDCSRHHLGVDGRPGNQCIQVPGMTIPLLHDGWKAFLSISKPTSDEMETVPMVELTSPRNYNPAKRVVTCRVNHYDAEEVHT